MPDLSRRRFLILTVAATGAARLGMPVAGRMTGRRVVTLVYDKGLGVMRAIDRLAR